MLGSDGDEIETLRLLNEIFLNRELWENLPPTTPDCIRLAWTGCVEVDDNDSAEVKKKDRGGTDEVVEVPKAEWDELEQRAERLARENAVLRRRLEKATGRRERVGASPTLNKVMEDFLARYTGRDSDHAKIVAGDLKRFVKHFGGELSVEKMDRREDEFRAWLNGLITQFGPRAGKRVSAGRRNQMRIYIIKLLESAGLTIDRTLWPPARAAEVRRDRGGIRWISLDQAERLAQAMDAPYDDAFRIQYLTGLRPDELLTLAAGDLSDDDQFLALTEKAHYTLKTGPRTIRVPKHVADILKDRWKHGKWAVPAPNGKKLWGSARRFDRVYRLAIQSACEDINLIASEAFPDSPEEFRIEVRLDARTGRRTFGSIKLREGWRTSDLASYMGTSEKMIREHYGAILSQEVKV